MRSACSIGHAYASPVKLPVVGDIELFAREVQAPVAAVTGTNGKTTTTELLAQMLNACGQRTIACGNIGSLMLTSLAVAIGTPLGRYQKAVSDAIGSRWYYYMNSKMDLVSIGTAHIEAQGDAQGHVQNLRVVSNNANEAFANICLQSFQEAHIPPIPPDLIAALPEGRMSVDFSFTAYSNQ